ncbi:MAG TPA: hypothetical protein PLA97_08135 [Rubrivivax sp.]|nr:hypothetical protein [Rubrivivax sp.]
MMAGEHCLHGFTNRDIRSQLNGTRWLRACADDPKKASARVGRCFRRLHAHGLIAKIPRTPRWRVTDYGRKVMGTTMYLREHHFPNAHAGVMHLTSSQETRKPQQKDLCTHMGQAAPGQVATPTAWRAATHR